MPAKKPIASTNPLSKVGIQNMKVKVVILLIFFAFFFRSKKIE